MKLSSVHTVNFHVDSSAGNVSKFMQNPNPVDYNGKPHRCSNCMEFSDLDSVWKWWRVGGCGLTHFNRAIICIQICSYKLQIRCRNQRVCLKAPIHLCLKSHRCDYSGSWLRTVLQHRIWDLKKKVNKNVEIHFKATDRALPFDHWLLLGVLANVKWSFMNISMSNINHYHKAPQSLCHPVS